MKMRLYRDEALFLWGATEAIIDYPSSSQDDANGVRRVLESGLRRLQGAIERTDNGRVEFELSREEAEALHENASAFVRMYDVFHPQLASAERKLREKLYDVGGTYTDRGWRFE